MADPYTNVFDAAAGAAEQVGAMAEEMQESLPFSYLEATGSKSGYDQSPLFWVKPEGERTNYDRVTLQEVRARLLRWQKEHDVSDEDMEKYLAGLGGFTWNQGNLGFQGRSASGTRVIWTHDEGGSIGGQSYDRNGRRTQGTPGTPGTPASPGGGGGGTGGNAAGATGGAARGSVSNPYQSTPGVSGGGGTEVFSGGGEGGGPPIDPNAALGIDFGQAAGGPALAGGQSRFRSDLFPRQGSILEGLDQNSSLYDLMLNTLRAQEGQQAAALGIAGGLMEGYEADPLRAQMRAGAADLMANPYSLDDRTVQRILAAQRETIGGNLEAQRQLSAGRAASAGISRSGWQEADQDRLGINAARDLAGAQRGLLVEQATRRPAELAKALQTGGGALQQDQAALERLGGGAIGVLDRTNLTGDALALGTLASGQAPQVNVAAGPRQGAFGSIYYSGPRNLNPYD